MRPRFLARSFIFAAAALTVAPAEGAFHLWTIVEAYSSTNGDVQFIELMASGASETQANGAQIRTDSGNTFTLTSNLGGNTNGDRLLFATAGFYSLPGAPAVSATQPTYVLPADFFNPANDRIRLFHPSFGEFHFRTINVANPVPTDNVFSRIYSGATSSIAANTPQSREVATAGSVNRGDYNSDGFVDEADYTRYRKTLTQAASPAGSGADGSTNGVIDAADELLWTRRFGNEIIGDGIGSGGSSSGSGIDVGPTVQIIEGGTQANGHLDEDGNWVWRVRVSQSSTPVDIDNGGPITAGSPLALSLGFSETSSQLLGAVNMNDGFDDPNPGKPIFGWENYSDTNGDAVIDSTPPSDDEPVGLQSNCAGGGCTENTPGDDPNTVFAALGSVDFGTDTDGKDFLRITTSGPSTAQPTTTINMMGAYGGNGRIAELNDSYDGDGNPPISVNYDNYFGSLSRTARGGDTDLNGTIDFADFGVLQTNYLQPGTYRWYHGDYDGDGEVTFADFGELQTHYFETYDVWTDMSLPGGSGAEGDATPEPATCLLLLVGWATLQLAPRRRSAFLG